MKYDGAVGRGGVTRRIVSDGLEVEQKSPLCILSVYVY